MSQKKGSQYTHPLKGPERLAPEVVKDIIESRRQPNARKLLSEKYGISQSRVGRLWVEYYGGGKISDYNTGLKKPLPTTPINNADITVRNVKTARAQYMAKEPEVEKIDPKKDAKLRAKPVRVSKINKELKIDDEAIEDITDQQAEIIAGQIGAGNDNPQLLAVFERLLESRDRDTEYLYKLAKKGIKKGSIDTSYSTETDYESSNIEDITDDDSTALYKQASGSPRQTRKGGSGNSGYDYGDSQAGVQDSPYSARSYGAPPSMVLRDSSSQPNQFNAGIYSFDGVRFAPTRAGDTGVRGQYEAGARAPQQANTYQNPGYQPPVSAAQYNPSTGGFQQSNAYNGSQLNAQSGQSGPIPGRGGDNVGQTVPGLPWLKVKPY